MSNPLLLDMAIYLQSLNLVEQDGEDLFRDFSPESPDNIVILYEYAGSPNTPQDTAVHRSIQVSVRNIDADLARTKALMLCDAFYTEQETRRIDFTSERWGQVYIRQYPFKVRLDENNRTIYAFNLGITTTIY